MDGWISDRDWFCEVHAPTPAASRRTPTNHAEARGGVRLDDEDAQELEEARRVHLQPGQRVHDGAEEAGAVGVRRGRRVRFVKLRRQTK